jgi:glycerol-3-phosphate acyltransferase PlsY
MIYILLAVFAAYLIGAVPTGFIFAKAIKGIDIRQHGSGNVGATNVFRILGKGPGIAVFVVDFSKGLLAVTVIPLVFKQLFPGMSTLNGGLYLILGAAAIAGHIWTVFLNFKGGKGVATTAGVMAGLAPLLMLAGLIIWAVAFSIWRYVSLASILAAISLPTLAAITGKDIYFVFFCSVLCIVGIYSHRSNIKRLLNGTEKKM